MKISETFPGFMTNKGLEKRKSRKKQTVIISLIFVSRSIFLSLVAL